MKGNGKHNAYIEERKLLHKQLQLLAEQSQDSFPEILPEISIAMCRIYKMLRQYPGSAAFNAYFLFMGTNFVICFVIFIKKLFRRKA